MARRGPGQPTKRSPEREQAILNSLRVGNTRRASARAAEVSEDTLANWMKADSVFFGAVTKAEADAELRFLGQVAKHAVKSPQAAQWWLERRRPADYRQRTGVEVSGPDGGPIDHREVSTLEDYEKLALSEAIRDHLARGRRSSIPAGDTEDSGAGD